MQWYINCPNTVSVVSIYVSTVHTITIYSASLTTNSCVLL